MGWLQEGRAIDIFSESHTKFPHSEVGLWVGTFVGRVVGLNVGSLFDSAQLGIWIG